MTYPEARLTPQGAIVSMDGEVELEDYSGLLYATFPRQGSYILWRFPDGSHEVINQGSVIVQAELDRFVRSASR